MSFNLYPYQDTHELNTDWIIGKIKNVETAEANTKQYAEDADAAKVAAEDARDLAIEAKDDAVEAKDDAVEAKDDAIEFLTDTRDQLNLLQARVDNIIPDGTQTAGNLELLDIRVSADGTTYASAGDAVRGQVTDLKDALSDIDAINLINDPSFDHPVTRTVNGVTITRISDNNYTFVGTASAPVINNFYDSENSVPSVLSVGNTYRLILKGISSSCQLRIVTYVNSIGTLTTYTQDGVYKFTIPSNATGITVRFFIGTGSVVNANCKVYIYDTEGDYSISNLYDIVEPLPPKVNSIINTIGCYAPFMELGNYGFQANNPIPTDSSYMADRRARTISSLHLKVGDTVSINGNTSLQYFLASYSGGVWTETSWISADTVISTEADYYIVIMKVGNLAISDISELISDFHIVSVEDAGYINNQINSLNTRVKNIEDREEPSLPDYYYANDYWIDKINEIRSASNILNGVVFAFITDEHWPSNRGYSKIMLRDILNKTSLSFVISGGDYAGVIGTQDTLDTQIAQTIEFADYIGKDRFYSTRGNHDFYNRTSDYSQYYIASWAEVYNTIFRTSERYFNHPLIEHGAYCIDIPAQSTRIIMINSIDKSTDPSDENGGTIITSTEQLQWIADCINEVSNYHIIAIAHVAGVQSVDPDDYTRQANVHDLLSAFANKTTYIGDISADFSSTTNELICQIVGHTHTDKSSVDDGVLTISTTSDATYNDDPNVTRTAGTVTEQAFDIYCFDFDSNTINTVRVGGGNNRQWARVNNAWQEVT